MSSMLRTQMKHLLLLTGATLAIPSATIADDAAGWDQARIALIAQQPTGMAQVVDRWDYLVSNDRLGFESYAGFILANPGFPRESLLRTRAENALDNEAPTSQALIAFFDRNPPLTNAGRARYALALASLNRSDALEVGRLAWRNGEMSGPSEAFLLGMFGAQLTSADHLARIDALLWQGEAEAAKRLIDRVPLEARTRFETRITLLSDDFAADEQLAISREDLSNPGLTYNLVRYYRKNGRLPQAIDTLANRPKFASLPFNAEAMVGELLRIARGAGAGPAVRIAASVDDLFLPGTDIRTQSYKLRDDYTSLMWLGGTKALWDRGDGKTAAPLFYRYGAAAQTPQTRSKGFYWAGLASQRAGDAAEAQRYWEMAATYPDRFYGMLALEKLGRPVPPLGNRATAPISAEERAAFEAKPLTKAVREVARNATWRTGIQFFREISEQATTPAEHLMVADLALQTGRRDLAVNLADAAQAHGHSGFTNIGYPTLQVPPGVDWTMVHAISRQESQFAQNAVSHAGARGLMQLMPGTAREQAGKQGMQYLSADLIDSPSYNMQLGDGYFARMLSYYGGAYPLAIAAYNAGPGNVNKWLRANGDPRTGGIDWITWIERIPIYETKNYVQRVIENAAVYEQLYPNRNPYGRARTVASFLR